MIGQYTLDLRVNSIRDTGALWRAGGGGCVSGRPHGSLEAVLRSTVRTTFKRLLHYSNPLQYVYSQAGEPMRIIWYEYIYFVTVADALEYLAPWNRITCLSIDSGPPGRPLLMNAISCHCCAKEMHARQPTVAVIAWNSAFTVWNSAEPSTASVHRRYVLQLVHQERGQDGGWRTASTSTSIMFFQKAERHRMEIYG